MKVPKVLVDLYLAHENRGFSGIPQDTRYLFRYLSNINDIETAGLIMGDYSCFDDLTHPLKQSMFLGWRLFEPKTSFIAKGLNLFSSRLAHVYTKAAPIFLKRKYDIFKLNKEFKHIVWRNYFSNVLYTQEFDFMKKEYYLTNLGHLHIFHSRIKSLPIPYLDIKEFDILLMQDVRVVKLGKKKIKIYRYHDGIPYLESDTTEHVDHTKFHYKAVKTEEKNKNAFFVCNSEAAQKDLETISPRAAERSFVIPYFIPRVKKVETNVDILKSIFLSKLSTAALNNWKEKERVESMIRKLKNVPTYILAVSTIEPRKNYKRLVHAWQILRYKMQKDVKLVIVGNVGWKYEKILEEMKPYVRLGDLIHLENVAQHELSYLYSAAKCFVSVSVNEGFGIPPVEAMICECPTVVSDISAHRYSCGNASIFCDPYNEYDIADKLYAILNNENLRQDLITKGLKNVKRYDPDTLIGEWHDLIYNLYAKIVK